jgi:hypothetical protein
MEKLLLSWTGPSLPNQLLLETMLLHDLGNLIKFDLRPEAPYHLMLPAELPFYTALQLLWRAKYGLEADEATCKLITKIPLKNGPRISQIILDHTAGTLAATVAKNDWLQKLCDYTDFRIGPHGMLTLAERFIDLKHRYAYRQLDWANQTGIDQRLKAFQTLETQLQTQVRCNLADLTAVDLGQIDRWLDFKFETN